ncbi:methyl-accepting chemotaxis protein [Xylophilus ampelinus]|uniref:Methyl-accepting chemotaxis protein n=1 Tax=Xylophilus ampelinus TaxID=54067 RepID=A0A318SX84_9BURK|nr:methyl-accepting chemotaxis protein [Xylophilus ampelinus]MCS4510772.1 methyl-accepting chemotaxis protein [Xylophilus ampelinus]PYE76253.1 methyl-accepting chemotaxis protein [Xylophilus ampelinus]
MHHWTVKQKIVSLISVVIVAFMALTGFLLDRQSAAKADMHSLYEKDYRAASIIGQIDGLLTRVDINILRMIAIGDPASIATWKAQNTERFTAVDKLLVELKAAADPGMAPQIATLAEAYGRMRSGMENQVKAVEAGDIPRGGEINRTQVKDNADKTFGTLADLQRAQDAAAQTKVDSQDSGAATTRVVSLVATVIVALGSLALGLLLMRSLLRQLGGEPGRAAEAVDAMARGDLSSAIAVRAGDSASLMARLREMQASLAGIVSTVRSNSESVATASSQISQGNHDLSQRTEEQASALQQTSATMDELGSTVTNNADNARQANQLALGASTVAAKGGDVVDQVIGTMKGINDSSRKISDIISVIDGIAFQTNILALNAAVEAARAGEQGRGFAVVASEVRSLAQRSAGAAKEIKTLITGSVEQVERGTALVDEAGRTMKEIVGAIQRVSDIVGEISSASAEQSTGVGQVGNAINEMDRATQQNAALVEESAAAASSLKIQAEQLVQAVAVFTLASENGSAALAPQRAAVAATPTVRPLPARTPAKLPRTTAPARVPRAFKSAPAPALAPAGQKAAAPAERPVAAASAGGADDWESF